MFSCLKGLMQVWWLCEMLVLLQDGMEEDKKIRAGFPMHHSTLTEITTIQRNRDIEI